MALFFDVTKAASAKQLSGLIRVSEKLRRSLSVLLADNLIPVVWHGGKKRFVDESRRPVRTFTEGDCFLTPEILSSEDRPGFFEVLQLFDVRSAAVFHDAIPLKFPNITWPHSVARHPAYMRDLSRFNHVFAVSEASRRDLHKYWEWLELSDTPTSSVITPGANFVEHTKNHSAFSPQHPPLVLNVGIIEPRKNQQALLEVACDLWDQGVDFELHFVGRVNPHFGKPIEKEIKKVRKDGRLVYLHSRQSDETLLDLYSKAYFTVFNSIVEGFGLPVIESLWLGIPCISSALSSLEHLGLKPACRFVSSKSGLKDAMSDWLTHPAAVEDAAKAATNLKLPLWADTARSILNWVEEV